MSQFMELMENWDGYRPVNQVRLSEAAMARALDLITNASRMPTHRHRYLLQEAITTSDFPLLFGGILDRQLLARYRAALPEWRRYCPVGTLPDFRVSTLHKVQGNDTRLPLVREKEEYPIAAMAEAHYDRQVFKHGRQFDISWEAIINDAMGAFDDMANRFLDAALMTEAWEVTSLYCGAAAPHAGLFGAPIVDVDGQAITNLGNLPLTINNLQTTLGLMASQTDVNGRPLGIRGVHLVVPPLLEITARQILTSAQVQQVDTAGAANAVPTVIIPLPTSNVLPQMGLQLHVDPLIPVVMPIAAANRTWFLFADQSQGKAMQLDFLRGHEAPEICMKASDKANVAGGLISPFEGDFATDNILWRVRHVLGGARLDPRYAYAQVGP